MTQRAEVVLAAGLAALTLAICVYFAPRGFQVGFVDMGHDGYQIRQVLDLTHGSVIFRDTFDQYGPLNGYLNVVGFLTLGRRLLAVKYFISAWYAVIVVVLYVIARHRLGPGLAAFSALVWVALAPFYNHGIMISPHAYALLFQALATLIAIRSKDLAPRRFAAIGLLAGLSWAVKQSIGVLYLLAIAAYLILRLLAGRAGWRRVSAAMLATVVAFVAVVGLSLTLIWTRGALADWYLQTVVFPREFYLPSAAASPSGAGPGPLTALSGSIAAFARAQFEQPLYWIIIRVVVLATALVQLLRRRADDDLLLLASITAFLWLAAYPSSNFMHQWWTASLTIAPFVLCVRNLAAMRFRGGLASALATVAVISVIVASGVYDRAKASAYSARALNETLNEPPMFRGIRTNTPTRRVFETFYGIMAGYRASHPGTRIVSIESSDGWGRGMVESLPFISFFDDNTHAQPVYWSLPVLTTTVYPRYGEALWRQIREERPLLVEHHNSRYRPYRISGYRLLVAARSDYGHWYVYAPEGDDAATASALYIASDGQTEHFSEADGPAAARRLNLDIAGAFRGRAAPALRRDDAIEVPGDDPFELVDPRFPGGRDEVNIYTWPSDLPRASLTGTIEPVPTDVIWRRERRDIVKELKPGQWRIDGGADAAFSYVLQWGGRPFPRGAYLVVRGELIVGGLQVGFLRNDHWANYVAVTRQGPFEAVIELQEAGDYALVLANCMDWSVIKQAGHALLSTLSLRRPAFLPNRFTVSEAGWVSPSSNDQSH